MRQRENSTREELHQLIEIIEDENILKAFLTLMKNLRNKAEDYELTDEQFEELKRREAEHLTGKSRSLTFEEFIEETRKNFGFERIVLKVIELLNCNFYFE